MKILFQFGLGLGTLAVTIAIVVILGRHSSGTPERDSPPLVFHGQTQSIGFHPANLDLGQAIWGSEVPFTLHFSNHSDETLTVESITATCNCLILDSAALKGFVISAPGDLKLLGRLKSGEHPGDLLRRVTLIASGREWHADVSLSVRGTWHVSEDIVDFGKLVLGNPLIAGPLAERKIEFTSDPDILIGDVTTDQPWVTAAAIPIDDARTAILVRLEEDALPPGLVSASVGFRTSSAVRPEGCIYVRARSVPALMARPAAVFLVGDEVRSIYITDDAGNPSTLDSVSCDSTLIDAHIEASGQVRVRSAVPDGGIASGSLVVTDSNGCSVRVPVEVFATTEVKR